MKEDFPKVDFIGIGAQKAATTWIFKCLAEHPDISVSNPKETFFFCDTQRYNFGSEYYRRCFRACDPNKIVGEFTTSYLSVPGTAEKIHEFYPDAKLIVCLRDPVKRAVSNFNHLEFKRKNKNLDFETALKKFPEIIEQGYYGKHLKKYFEIFPTENILVMVYEDIENDPAAFIKRIFSFLGADDNFMPKGVFSKVNTTAARKSLINKKINRIYLKKGNTFLVSRMIKLARFVGLNKYKMDAFFKRNEYNEIENHQFEMLVNIYKDDINNLKSLINHNLENWTNIKRSYGN